jgi:hypothetical protein
MFGNAEWFEPKKIGWGLRPVKWQGWVYTGVWGSVIVLPFLALLANSGIWESLVWMGATVGMLTWDVWHMRRGLTEPNAVVDRAEPRDDVLYIGDDEQADRLATANFDMELRR